MATPPKLRRVSKEDFPEAEPWFGRFLDSINPFLNDTVSLLSGNITKDNLRKQTETVTFTTRPNLADTFSSGKFSIKNKLGVAPYSVQIAQVFGADGSNLPYTSETWVTPTLLNSWVLYDAGHNTPGYWMDGHGVVHLRGAVKDGTTAANTVIFTLPAGFRPEKREIFACNNSGAFGSVGVEADGDVTIVAGGSTYLFLDGITFRSTVGSGIAVGTPQWEYTQSGTVKINYIPGLRANTKYTITFVLE